MNCRSAAGAQGWSPAWGGGWRRRYCNATDVPGGKDSTPSVPSPGSAQIPDPSQDPGPDPRAWPRPRTPGPGPDHGPQPPDPSPDHGPQTTDPSPQPRPRTPDPRPWPRPRPGPQAPDPDLDHEPCMITKPSAAPTCLDSSPTPQTPRPTLSVPLRAPAPAPVRSGWTPCVRVPGCLNHGNGPSQFAGRGPRSRVQRSRVLPSPSCSARHPRRSVPGPRPVSSHSTSLPREGPGSYWMEGPPSPL